MIQIQRALSFVLLASAVFLSGCGDPKVETTTDETMKESLARVKAALPEEKRVEFEKALKSIAFADINNLGDLVVAGSTGGLERRIRDRVNGKTGEEIIAEAKRITAEKEARDQKSMVDGTEKLRAVIDGDNPELLSKFVVERASLTRAVSAPVGEPGIELSVRNGTGQAISRAEFQAILITPGREVPWVDESFSYSISGGLEPGEAAVWKLKPNRFGAWRNTPEDLSEVVLIVRPVAIEGADGKAIASNRFGADGEKWLREWVDSIPLVDAAELKKRMAVRSKAFTEWKAAAIAASVKAERDQLIARKSGVGSRVTEFSSEDEARLAALEKMIFNNGWK